MNAEELLAAIAQEGENYARFVEALPVDVFHRRREPDGWSAAEISGHVAEFPATHAMSLCRLAERPGSSFGRTPDDPARTAAVAGSAGATPAEAAAAVRAAVSKGVAALRALPPAAWQVKGVDVLLGELTVAEAAERRILGHLRSHLQQARAATDAGS